MTVRMRGQSRGKRPARPHVEGVVAAASLRSRAAAASPRRARSSRRCRCTAPVRGSGPERRARRSARRVARAGARWRPRRRRRPAGDARWRRARPATWAPARRRSPPAWPPPGRPCPARTRCCRSLRNCVITAVFRPANEKSRLALCSSGRGSSKALGVAERRQPRQRRPARVAQAHQLGRLVEGLAGRVVDGLAEQRVAAHVVDPHQLRVPAGDEQRDEREARRVGREKRRQQMAFEVVHAERRPVQRRGQRARHAGADEQRPGQAGAARVGNDVDVSQDVRVSASTCRVSGSTRRMWSRDASSGTTPPYAAMHLDLAVQRLREQGRRLAGVRLHQRDAGLVAGGFDAEDDHWTECIRRVAPGIRQTFADCNATGAAVQPSKVERSHPAKSSPS